MTAASGHGAAEHNGVGGGADVRVILVGRTGLDASLRLDSGVELVRARTAVAAIGELASPIDPAAPTATTVIVGLDADPGDRAPAFVEGLRLLDPRVRVLAATGEGTAAPAWCDGAIGPRTGAEELRRLVRRVHRAGVEGSDAPGAAKTKAEAAEGERSLAEWLAEGGEHVEPEQAGAGAPETATAAPEAQEGVAPALEGDAVLAEALLTGCDVVLGAMELVRRRLGAADVSFVADHERASSNPAATWAAVEHRGRRMGWLCSKRASGAALAEQGAWLGTWLALRDQQEQLKRGAFTDDLTGAWNRRYFDRFLRASIEHARQHRLSVTVLCFDIDDFKKYNDRYGHAAGDEILQETVRLLKSVIRPTDRVCRIGGDEFAVVFHEPGGPRETGSKPPALVGQIARRFQKQICEHRFPKLAEEAPGTLTVSGGLAAYPWDGRTAEELVERADELALQSKRQGKNAITLGPGAEKVCGPTGQGDQA